ncbi:4'-phosphopantetheinyl transferase superfamily protein [Streptomyces sp. KL116D]|uniref:4'-phosphopantetheinyl transferase family protein n=1 Tax=Streptomyces sp. KL116D TaxID=3045152 RepID=UPI0035575390
MAHRRRRGTLAAPAARPRLAALPPHRRPHVRYRFVASRLATKYTAAADCTPTRSSSTSAYKIGGRPYLRGLDQIDVSLTHRRPIAVGVSRDGRIGVDAEPADRRMSYDLLSGHVLTPAERADLDPWTTPTAPPPCCACGP